MVCVRFYCIVAVIVFHLQWQAYSNRHGLFHCNASALSFYRVVITQPMFYKLLFHGRLITVIPKSKQTVFVLRCDPTILTGTWKHINLIKCFRKEIPTVYSNLAPSRILKFWRSVFTSPTQMYDSILTGCHSDTRSSFQNKDCFTGRSPMDSPYKWGYPIFESGAATWQGCLRRYNDNDHKNIY